MHIRKEFLFFLMISLAFLFIVGCGEDEIEDAPPTPQMASALLENVYPYGMNIYATFGSDGSEVKHRSNKFTQSLEALPVLPTAEPAYEYQMVLFRDNGDSLDVTVATEFQGGTEIEYVNPDDQNVAQKYNIYRIMLNYTGIGVNPTMLFEARIPDEIYDRVANADENDALLVNNGTVQPMMTSTVKADTTEEQNVVEDILVNEVKPKIERIHEVSGEIEVMSKFASTPYMTTANNLSAKCVEVIGYIDEETIDKDKVVAGVFAIRDLVHELITFYPTYFIPTPSAQANIEDADITITVNELSRLPVGNDGWVYVAWFKNDSQTESIISFNTNTYGASKTFTRLEKYPTEYNKIGVSMCPLILFDDTGNELGVTILEGNIVK